MGSRWKRVIITVCALFEVSKASSPSQSYDIFSEAQLSPDWQTPLFAGTSQMTQDHSEMTRANHADCFSQHGLHSSLLQPLLLHTHSTQYMNQFYNFHQEGYENSIMYQDDRVGIRAESTLRQESSLQVPNVASNNEVNMPITNVLSDTGRAELGISKSLPRKRKKKCTPKKPYQPGFPARHWQDNLSKDDVKRLYEGISKHWPIDTPLDAIQKCDKYLSNFFDRHRDVVQRLINGDHETWVEIINWSMPENMLIRSARYIGRKKGPNKRKIHTVNLQWLASPLESSDKDFIYDRLSRHWQGINHELVYSRLLRYAKRFGKIHSPEPLLEEDEERFRQAADAIYKDQEDIPMGSRHYKASLDDLLHQADSPYSVLNSEGRPMLLFPRGEEDKQLRPNASRYSTGQEWMNTKSRKEIDKIHAAVASHWVDKLYIPRREKFLCQVNEFLEVNKDYIERIEKGDDYAAWYVAHFVCEKSQYLKDPDKYSRYRKDI